jgi:L-ascorbate metabolism protein UlaG (beta-lactamase superfamily)
VDGKTIVNLGDTLLHLKEWASIKNPDVLMIPIGGREAHNTMDEEEALQAVRMMKPKLVIPCHYNLPAFFTKKYCAADDTMFKKEVEKTGANCVILHENESVQI